MGCKPSPENERYAICVSSRAYVYICVDGCTHETLRVYTCKHCVCTHKILHVYTCKQHMCTHANTACVHMQTTHVYTCKHRVCTHETLHVYTCKHRMCTHEKLHVCTYQNVYVHMLQCVSQRTVNNVLLDYRRDITIQSVNV